MKRTLGFKSMHSMQEVHACIAAAYPSTGPSLH